MKASDKKIVAYFPEAGASELVFWSFRYFLGRMSIAVSSFAESLAAAWPHIDPRFQSLIKKELEEEFRRDDEARVRREELKQKVKNGEAKEDAIYQIYLPLGHDCDRESWQKVRNAYNNTLP